MRFYARFGYHVQFAFFAIHPRQTVSFHISHINSKKSSIYAEENVKRRNAESFIRSIGHELSLNEKSVEKILEDRTDMLDIIAMYQQSKIMSYSSKDSRTPVSILCSRVGINKKKLREMAKKHPWLTMRVLLEPELQISTIDVLKSKLLFSTTNINRLSEGYPHVLRRIYRLDLRKKLSLMKSCIGLSEEEMKKIILKQPKLLGHSLVNIVDIVDFFSDKVGLDNDDIKQMTLAMPLVLTLTVEENLKMKVDFLRNDVGCSKSQTKTICKKYPQFFGLSIKNSLIPKIQFLQNKIKLMRRADLSRVISLFPPLLWLSETNINDKIDFLKGELKMDDEELRALFVTMPQLLSLSITNNLRPKLNFLLHGENLTSIIEKDVISNEGYLTRDELKDFVLYQPAFLAYSLENRIKPRLTKMSAASISLRFSPRYILSITDKKFEDWLDNQCSSWSVSKKTRITI